MTVKELKEQIKNLNDNIEIFIDSGLKIHEIESIGKKSRRGRDAKDEECTLVVIYTTEGQEVQVETNTLIH
jgi:hypothetical protein